MVRAKAATLSHSREAVQTPCRAQVSCSSPPAGPGHRMNCSASHVTRLGTVMNCSSSHSGSACGRSNSGDWHGESMAGGGTETLSQEVRMQSCTTEIPTIRALNASILKSHAWSLARHRSTPTRHRHRTTSSGEGTQRADATGEPCISTPQEYAIPCS